MKHHLLLIIIIITAILAIGNWQWQSSSEKDTYQVSPKIAPTRIRFPKMNESFDCPHGLMTLASYQYGRDEAPPSINGLPEKFLIVADTNQKPTNFYSAEEDEAWELSKSVDTAFLKAACYWEGWRNEWDTLTSNQKQQKVLQRREQFKKKAEYLHKVNNNGQMQVWIINNTQESVSFQVWSNEFMCIMEALTKQGQWMPIEYRIFYGCWIGTDLFPRGKWFPPKTANSFVTTIPNKGDYKTKIRFKILGSDRYYYSNSFEGKIDYCSFVMDSTTKNAHLDMLGHYSMFKEALFYTSDTSSARDW